MNWITDIVVPLTSAFIGGLIALIGVGITLYRDRKVRDAEKAEIARPFFCPIDYGDSRIIPSNSHVFLFSFVGTTDYHDCLQHVQGNFINSNKAEFIIEKITVGNHCYFPLRPEMIEKDMAFMIKFNYKENLTANPVIMHIMDLNYQKRMYQFIIESDKVVRLVELENIPLKKEN